MVPRPVFICEYLARYRCMQYDGTVLVSYSAWFDAVVRYDIDIRHLRQAPDADDPRKPGIRRY